MKKKLLSVAILAMGLSANAQNLKSQNFDSLINGNLSTDLSGQYYGQGNIVLNATNGNLANYQIVDNAVKGKVLNINFPTLATNSYISDIFTWSNRTAGNDILVFTQWIYTGSATQSDYRNRYAIFGSASQQSGSYIGGFQFDHASKVISGYAFAALDNDTAPRNYLISLGLSEEQPNVTLPANTWVELKYSYNTANKRHSFYIDGILDGYVTGTLPIAGETNPSEYVNITFNASNSTNASYSALVDEYNIIATNSTNLSTESNELVIGEIKLYPNPANDVVNIASTQGVIEHYAIVDLTGKTVKFGEVSNLENLSVNVQDLASGAYIMNIKTDKAIKNLKFVKK